MLQKRPRMPPYLICTAFNVRPTRSMMWTYTQEGCSDVALAKAVAMAQSSGVARTISSQGKGFLASMRRLAQRTAAGVSEGRSSSPAPLRLGIAQRQVSKKQIAQMGALWTTKWRQDSCGLPHGQTKAGEPWNTHTRTCGRVSNQCRCFAFLLVHKMNAGASLFLLAHKMQWGTQESAATSHR